MSTSETPEKAKFSSPPWRTETRTVVAVLFLILTGSILYGLRQLFAPLLLALMLAYLLLPVVKALARLRLSRGAAVLLVYLLLVVFLIVGTTGAGLAITQQVTGAVRDLRSMAALLPERLEPLTNLRLVIGPWEIDLAQTNLSPIIEALTSSLQPFLTQTGTLLASVLGATASTVALTILILVLGYYLLRDLDSLEDAFINLVPEDYQVDFRRLLSDTRKVWRAFLRGQLLLGIVIGSLTAIAYLFLRVRFALGLGLVAGLLEFVPFFGPVIAGVIAVLVALFQGITPWGLSPITFALIVGGVAVVIQQIENNLLVPRIIGHSLNLHPMIVLVSALGGGILAGVLGVLLAAPVVATGRIWMGYFYRKTVGIETWPDPIVSRAEVSTVSLRERIVRRFRRRRPTEGVDLTPSELSPPSEES